MPAERPATLEPAAWTPTLIQGSPCPQRAVLAVCPALQQTYPDQDRIVSTSVSPQMFWESHAVLTPAPASSARPAICIHPAGTPDMAPAASDALRAMQCGP